jgi:hypothetical protein
MDRIGPIMGNRKVWEMEKVNLHKTDRKEMAVIKDLRKMEQIEVIDHRKMDKVDKDKEDNHRKMDRDHSKMVRVNNPLNRKMEFKLKKREIMAKVNHH